MLKVAFTTEGIIRFSGVLDETFPVDYLLQQDPPLRLNLELVTAVNSIGVREFIKFMLRWGDKPIELHLISPAFVEAINVFGAMLGSPPDKKKVKSAVVEYICKNCDVSVLEPVRFENWRFYDEMDRIEIPDCGDCGEPLSTEEVPFETFLFLHADD